MKEDIRRQAYTQLAEILDKYKRQMIHLEKQKLTKERVFYLREDNTIKYEQALRKMELVDEDVNDNLTKMAKHILNPDLDILKEYGYDGRADEEQGVEERISRARAAELLEIYKRMKVRAE